MIFVTVGHQMPFDRLIRAVDQWAQANGRRDVFGQIGAGAYRPKCFGWQSQLTPDEFRSRMMQASAVVGHAGTGTIIAAMQYRKPLLVLPRLSSLGETRNDHQIPTAQHFAATGQIRAAYDEIDLIAMLDDIERFQPSAGINGSASPELLARLREFAWGKAEPGEASRVSVTKSPAIPGPSAEAAPFESPRLASGRVHGRQEGDRSSSPLSR